MPCWVTPKRGAYARRRMGKCDGEICSWFSGIRIRRHPYRFLFSLERARTRIRRAGETSTVCPLRPKNTGPRHGAFPDSSCTTKIWVSGGFHRMRLPFWCESYLHRPGRSGLGPHQARKHSPPGTSLNPLSLSNSSAVRPTRNSTASPLRRAAKNGVLPGIEPGTSRIIALG